MKITNNVNDTISFNQIPNGAVFSLVSNNSQYYIKICEIYDKEDDCKYNAVNLSSGIFGNIADITNCTVYPKAELILN